MRGGLSYLASNISRFPSVFCRPPSSVRPTLAFNLNRMPITFAGIGLIAIWAIATIMYEAPGWIHLLLTAGVALVVYGVVQSSGTKTKRTGA